MAKMEMEKYGVGTAESLDFKQGAGKAFNEKSGGDIDPYGDKIKKDSSAINMNAGEAFTKKDYTKVDVMGTDAAKTAKKQFSNNDGDHLKQMEVDPYGNDAGKKQSYQPVKRK